MSKPLGSIRSTLLSWILWPLLLLTLVLALVLYQLVLINANHAFDRALLGAALAIADRVVIEGEEVVVDLPYVALEMLSATAKERVYYRIEKANGDVITGYEDLPQAKKQPWIQSPMDGEWFYDTAFIGQPVRVAVISRTALGGRHSERFFVYIAETTNSRQDMATRSLIIFASGAALLLLLVLAMVFYSLHRGLSPLRSFSSALGRRTASDLHPLTTPVPKELVPVEHAINQLLLRIEGYQSEQQRFVNDASHQLRTPLATLKTQLSLAQRSCNEAMPKQQIEKAQQTLERSIRLTQQLLSHARAWDNQNWQIVALNPLVAALCREWVPNAMSKHIDLGFEDADTALYTHGDGLLLQEALRNLIENALHHGRPSMQVTVRLYSDKQRVMISVKDDGPGIDPHHQSRIFDRFFRPPGAHASGSGLGLAIVQKIAKLHSGTVDCVPSQRGAHFLLTLPLVTRPEALSN